MERYYTIQDVDEFNFRAGSTAEGEQILMGSPCPGLVVVKFDAEGRFLGCETRPWEQLPRRKDGWPYEFHERPFQDALNRQWLEWQREMGFEPGTISVRKFFLDDLYLGIKDRPAYLEEYLADPSNSLWGGEEESQYYAKLIKDWEEAGQFVLWWGKDYFMDADGDIEST